MLFRQTGMKIYTKTGDTGTTGLYGSKRLSKADARIESYGTLDELSCTIGLIISSLKTNRLVIKEVLTQTQTTIYELMGFLAGAPIPLGHLDAETEKLEKQIDQYYTSLPALSSFILPQGSRASVEAHLARAVCRRAERALVRCLEMEKRKAQPYYPIFRYLNRLSDYFFVLARSLNTSPEVIIRRSSRVDK